MVLFMNKHNDALLPEIAFLRLSAILKLIPISKSTWWAGVKSGRYPKPVKLSTRTTAWRVEEIRNLINNSNLTQTGTNNE